MRSLIIHMRGNQKRQLNAKKLLSDLPSARIVDAVVGQQVLDSNGFALHPGDLHTPHYPFPLTPGEVGCFLSHRQCWQQIVSEGLEYALIAEDDLAIDPTIWPETLDLLHSHASADTYIRIPAKQREKPAAMVARRDHAALFLPRVIGLQTVCQVVGRNAAQRLLDASAALDRPVDTFIQMHWITGQPVHTILPGGVRELTDELGGSTIQKKSRTGLAPMREIKRTWYRAQIDLRPQKI